MLFLGYNEFISAGFYGFLPVFTNFDDEFGGDPVIIASQSGWCLNEDIKMSHPVNFGQLIVINSSFCSYITAKKCKKTILQQNMACGMVKFTHNFFF